ncbi:hypothetical protein [Mycoplasmopsis verecunda]|uniref:DNA repair exonuclease SbcCD ATPase subunit n=1 Tax=Mycoplasmopsis verecunda TaxID=171291 RepID=A0A1T4M7R6_9BACT|nr:hypothetical protein [Mycoplasmopsis verecunda]WPB54361.1 hypothetical protein SAM46_02630 [Mycoplasmopsis verecunda]SJZ62744.1 DNA repair exonuclease SbcCD ATPase subunit [Mycoplasmopsis verecunda]
MKNKKINLIFGGIALLTTTSILTACQYTKNNDLINKLDIAKSNLKKEVEIIKSNNSSKSLLDLSKILSDKYLKNTNDFSTELLNKNIAEINNVLDNISYFKSIDNKLNQLNKMLNDQNSNDVLNYIRNMKNTVFNNYLSSQSDLKKILQNIDDKIKGIQETENNNKNLKLQIVEQIKKANSIIKSLEETSINLNKYNLHKDEILKIETDLKQNTISSSSVTKINNIISELSNISTNVRNTLIDNLLSETNIIVNLLKNENFSFLTDKTNIDKEANALINSSKLISNIPTNYELSKIDNLSAKISTLIEKINNEVSIIKTEKNNDLSILIQQANKISEESSKKKYLIKINEEIVDYVTNLQTEYNSIALIDQNIQNLNSKINYWQQLIRAKDRIFADYSEIKSIAQENINKLVMHNLDTNNISNLLSKLENNITTFSNDEILTLISQLKNEISKNNISIDNEIRNLKDKINEYKAVANTLSTEISTNQLNINLDKLNVLISKVSKIDNDTTIPVLKQLYEDLELLINDLESKIEIVKGDKESTFKRFRNILDQLDNFNKGLDQKFSNIKNNINEKIKEFNNINLQADIAKISSAATELINYKTNIVNPEFQSKKSAFEKITSEVAKANLLLDKLNKNQYSNKLQNELGNLTSHNDLLSSTQLNEKLNSFSNKITTIANDFEKMFQNSIANNKSVVNNINQLIISLNSVYRTNKLNFDRFDNQIKNTLTKLNSYDEKTIPQISEDLKSLEDIYKKISDFKLSLEETISYKNKVDNQILNLPDDNYQEIINIKNKYTNITNSFNTINDLTLVELSELNKIKILYSEFDTDFDNVLKAYNLAIANKTKEINNIVNELTSWISSNNELLSVNKQINDYINLLRSKISFNVNRYSNLNQWIIDANATKIEIQNELYNKKLQITKLNDYKPKLNQLKNEFIRWKLETNDIDAKINLLNQDISHKTSKEISDIIKILVVATEIYQNQINKAILDENIKNNSKVEPNDEPKFDWGSAPLVQKPDSEITKQDLLDMFDIFARDKVKKFNFGNRFITTRLFGDAWIEWLSTRNIYYPNFNVSSNYFTMNYKDQDGTVYDVTKFDNTEEYINNRTWYINEVQTQFNLNWMDEWTIPSQYRDEVSRFLHDGLAQLNDGMSEWDKAWALFKYVRTWFSYKGNNTTLDKKITIHFGVCKDIATSYSFLLNAANITAFAWPTGRTEVTDKQGHTDAHMVVWMKLPVDDNNLPSPGSNKYKWFDSDVNYTQNTISNKYLLSFDNTGYYADAITSPSASQFEKNESWDSTYTFNNLYGIPYNGIYMEGDVVYNSERLYLNKATIMGTEQRVKKIQIVPRFQFVNGLWYGIEYTQRHWSSNYSNLLPSEIKIIKQKFTDSTYQIDNLGLSESLLNSIKNAIDKVTPGNKRNVGNSVKFFTTHNFIIFPFYNQQKGYGIIVHDFNTNTNKEFYIDNSKNKELYNFNIKNNNLYVTWDDNKDIETQINNNEISKFFESNTIYTYQDLDNEINYYSILTNSVTVSEDDLPYTITKKNKDDFFNILEQVIQELHTKQTTNWYKEKIALVKKSYNELINHKMISKANKVIWLRKLPPYERITKGIYDNYGYTFKISLLNNFKQLFEGGTKSLKADLYFSDTLLDQNSNKWQKILDNVYLDALKINKSIVNNPHGYFFIKIKNESTNLEVNSNIMQLNVAENGLSPSINPLLINNNNTNATLNEDDWDYSKRLSLNWNFVFESDSNFEGTAKIHFLNFKTKENKVLHSVTLSNSINKWNVAYDIPTSDISGIYWVEYNLKDADANKTYTINSEPSFLFDKDSYSKINSKEFNILIEELFTSL